MHLAGGSTASWQEAATFSINSGTLVALCTLWMATRLRGGERQISSTTTLTYAEAQYTFPSIPAFLGTGRQPSLTTTLTCMGGVTYVSSDSSVSWYGATTFFRNNTDVYGGAIPVAYNSHTPWLGATTFSHNSACLNGSATSMYWGRRQQLSPASKLGVSTVLCTLRALVLCGKKKQTSPRILHFSTVVLYFAQGQT